jgi:SAM-dependent methyltransferase
MSDRKNYRWYIGGEHKYDLMGAMQFNLLTALGLRDYHKLLDIGCGSLRAGRLFIPYLNPGCYCGIEPEKWLVEEGIKNEVGSSMLEVKSPRFEFRDDFPIASFGEKFDYMLAHSIFTHASQTQIIKCLKNVKRHLNPSSDNVCSGVLVATVLLGEEDYQGTEWLWPGKTKNGFAYYTKECIQRLAQESELMCKFINWTHTHGQHWVIFGHENDVDKFNDTPVHDYSK